MASHTLSSIALSSSTLQPPTAIKTHGASSSLLPWRHCPSTFLVGQRLTIRKTIFRNLALKRRPFMATVLSCLPTAKIDSASNGKIPQWSARAIKAFCMSKLETTKLKYPKLGTESLLMGILVEGTSNTAKFLRANGITLFKVRDETVNLLGKSDMYFFSPLNPPLTEQAQRALDSAVEQKLKSGGSGEITTTHILLGIWAEKNSAGHKILASLGFDDEKAKELGKTMDKDYELSYK